MPPLRDQTGVPGLVAFAHFHSSTISGSAAVMIPRTSPSVLPRQSPSSRIRSSISLEASPFSAAMDDLRQHRVDPRKARLRTCLDAVLHRRVALLARREAHRLRQPRTVAEVLELERL